MVALNFDADKPTRKCCLPICSSVQTVWCVSFQSGSVWKPSKNTARFCKRRRRIGWVESQVLDWLQERLVQRDELQQHY